MADSTNYVADNSAFGGPNATQAATANSSLGVTPPISAAGLTTPVTPINVPTLPTPDTHAATNASIPNPPPTPESIITAAASPTAAQNNQSGILGKIAELMKGKTSLSTLQTDQETAAGVPALSNTLKGISTQIQGYNDQSSKLALDASAGGTIENQQQRNAQGRGITAGGLQPFTSADLRNNQIQQATIAGQALTAKAAYYAANNDYTTAKDAADKAAQVQFDAVQQQIDYQNALLAAIKPTLDKETADHALLVKAQLDQRQVDVNNAREDMKAGQGLAITAMTLNPDNAAAQSAAQQALKLDPNDPQYLTKVAALVAPYQKDPAAAQAAVDDHLYKRAQIDKLNAEAKALNPGTPTITNPQAVQYRGALSVILGSAKFTKEQKTAVVNAVNNGEDPVSVIKNQAKNIMGQTEATKVTGFETAKSSLQDIQTALANFYANGGSTSIFSGNYEKVINNLGNVNDPKLVDLATQIQASLQIYRNAVSGTAYSAQEGADIASIFPGINKSQGLNTAILSGRMKAFDSVIDGAYRSALGSTYDALKPTVTPKGTQTSTAYVESILKAQGKSYADIIAQIPKGQKGVINNATGELGSIPESEFDPSKYTPL